MNDEELAETWTMLAPTAGRRQRIDRQVSAWLDARDTPLAVEWLALVRVEPFAALGLATVSAVAIVATPVIWLARALI
jgi:hypothetical protein